MGESVTLRLKTLVIIGATLLGLLVAFAILSRFTLLSRFAVYENDQVRSHVERASTALENELDQLSTIARDDAQWDAAYNFVVHGDRRFLEENFPSSAYVTMRLHLIEYVNASGQVIFQGPPGARRWKAASPAVSRKRLGAPVFWSASPPRRGQQPESWSCRMGR